MWKQEKFYLGPDRSELCVLLGHPLLHTTSSRNRKGFFTDHKSFKQNWIISICSRLIAFLVIWAPQVWEWGYPHMHCMHIDVKRYMYRNCKMASFMGIMFTMFNICVCICVHVHAVMHGHFHTPKPPSTQLLTPIHSSTLPPPPISKNLIN